MTGSTVSLRKVARHFTLDSAPPIEVLRDVNLEVNAGDSVAILGPSGSGKTTLLQLLGALDHPDSGAVLIDGQDLALLNESARTAWRNRKIGSIFQFHHLLPQLTVLENVLVPAWASGSGGTLTGRATQLLDRVGLAHRHHHRPAQLSGGERQRVALVRALIMSPTLLLADEPTGSLDHAGAATLADLLVELNREEKVTLIAVTHSQDLASRLSRRLLLQDGVLQPV